MSHPQFVTNITKDFGVAVIPQVENGGDDEDQALGFHMEYGDKSLCDFEDDECNDDGILWQADDMGAPYFCTTHYFPQEQLGYEFIAKEDY